VNHSFVASGGDADICVKCKFPQLAHTETATCDCCPNIGPVEIRYGNMLMCAACWDKEQKVSAEHMSPENQNKRVLEYRTQQNKIIEQSRAIDNNITVRTEIYNAQTVSINDLASAINSNPEINNKPFALAEELTNRLNNLKKAAFEIQEQLVNNNSEQRAIQQYMNDLANKLRAEEREKLKLQDINYKPASPKASKPKTITTTGVSTKPVKVDKAARAKAAKDLGISEFTLQQMILMNGGDLDKAVAKLKELQAQYAKKEN
jgi:hypothetical protein